MHNRITTLHAFDLDGTLLKKNSSFAFALYLYRKGIFLLSDFLFCCSCYFQHLVFKRSLVWVHSRVFWRLFKNKSLSFFNDHLDAFLDQNLSTMLYEPALLRLKVAQKKMHRVLILSTSPIFLVEKIARRLSVEHYCATSYELRGKNVIHELKEVIDGDKKAAFMHKYCEEQGLHNISSIAYSDSSLDLAFLQAATISIAVRPDRKLREFAKSKGWEIL